MRIVGGNLQFQDDTSINVWGKPLSNGDVALAFGNVDKLIRYRMQ